ncbi:MAG: hypothetical protein UT41_C0003G0002 [Candidatus Wolfebacteria bacterium GW2011_GWC2_39_22]|uniref:Uncharacterized protein n=2 Tax=Candidatus Wolfeibacteriota TaxID=1752735 RepID=A0A0G1K4X8_9BACT|nr:MAG: hypothetical protein UT41_C0003G0002 [Candidatus Wolfebacteria bacterium GW2011_GWC2_39_22]KKT42899.1 MAG: hypothetical protein UW32_C0003G0002 [Candidatus Wolfebacteria bacterium GW2011_GWE2_44_13]
MVSATQRCRWRNPMIDLEKEMHKQREEMRLAARVWWLILWHASKEGTKEIPTQYEWLSSELVAALFEELTERKFWYSWQHSETGKEESHAWNVWPLRLNTELEQCERYHQRKFDGGDIESKLRKVLKWFVWQNFQFERSDKSYDSELNLFHTNNTPFPSGNSRFKPCRDMYEKAVSDVLLYTSANHTEVCEWCRKIALLMQPYIDRDMAYIRKHRSH